MIELVARKLDPDIEVTLDQLTAKMDLGEWDVREAYLMSDPPADSTGLFVGYLLGSDLRWSEIRWPTSGLEPQRGTDAEVRAVIAKIEAKDTPVETVSTFVEGRADYEPSNELWSGLLFTMIPWLFVMGLFLFFIMRQMRSAGGGGGIMSFGRSKVKMVTPRPGEDHLRPGRGRRGGEGGGAPRSSHFLKDPEALQPARRARPAAVCSWWGRRVRARRSSRKAIAGEANVPFFAISGSATSSRCSSASARPACATCSSRPGRTAPCVIFLDEIDAVGRKRGAGLGGGHDEREQTLNAMLVEMDGFDSDAGIIMIAATNRPDVLDAGAAAARGASTARSPSTSRTSAGARRSWSCTPRSVKMLGSDVDLSEVARGTPMFSGAELEALINEAALIATLKDKEQHRAGGPRGGPRQGALRPPEEAVGCMDRGGQVARRPITRPGTLSWRSTFKGEVEPVHKVTIIPRGMALGATMQLPEKRQVPPPASASSLGMLAVLYGGRVAEELFCDDISPAAPPTTSSAPPTSPGQHGLRAGA